MFGHLSDIAAVGRPVLHVVPVIWVDLLAKGARASDLGGPHGAVRAQVIWVGPDVAMCAQVIWVDLLTKEEFEAGFGSHTPILQRADQVGALPHELRPRPGTAEGGHRGGAPACSVLLRYHMNLGARPGPAEGGHCGGAPACSAATPFPCTMVEGQYSLYGILQPS